MLLLDIALPRLNGYDVCRRLRKEAWGRSIAIVAVTGWEDEQHRGRSAEAGFDGHLLKPLSYAALEALLHSLVGR